VFPIDTDAPRPEIPHSERIFAASKELHDAYARDEEWTRAMPLHEATVLFFLEMTGDAIHALNTRWDEAGRPGHFPDSLAVRDELNRIVCVEGICAGAGAPESR
jgi:hypothetical protein